MKNLILWLLLLWVCIGRSQTITIKDVSTGKPIESVNLLSEIPRLFAATNIEGQADVTAFRDVEKIEIRRLGYKPVVKSYSDLVKLNFEILLHSSSTQFDEVVVSATRWSEPSENIPSKISSISAEEVELYNPQTAADLLASSGEVFIQKSQQGGGSPMIRGFATNRLLYTVDGVRMNTAIFRSGNIQNVINMDPFAVENTEVLFGPGSVIYGSDAIGGVMSFQTLTPQLSLTDEILIKGKAVSRYSSANNEKTGHFDVGVGWKKWAFVTSLSSWDYDHLKQGSIGPEDYIKDIYVQQQDSVDVIITQDDPLLQIPTAYSQINLMQKVRFKPNNAWDMEYAFHFSNTSAYGRYDRHNRYRNGTLRYSEWNYGPQKWLMNHLSISNQSANILYDKMTLRLAHQSFEESRIDRSLNNNERNTQKEQVEAYSLNLDLIKAIGKKHTLFYGCEYIINDVTSTGLITDISTGSNETGASRYPQSEWTSIAAYLNEEYRLSRKFTLQTGVRYNIYMLKSDFSNNLPFYPLPYSTAQINNGAMTGSLGGVYRPSEKLSLRTNVGTAFRAPNVDDLGKVFDSEPGALTIPNPELEAEYAYNIDLGVAKVFGESVKIDLTGYYTILQNAMVRRPYTLNGQDSVLYDGEMSQVQAIQNAAVANVYGIQAGVEIKLTAQFTFLSNLNYQIGEEELDDGSRSSTRHAAPMFGVSRLCFKHKKLSLEFNSFYQAERSFDNLPVEEQKKDEIYAKDGEGNNYSPFWYTLNVKALYDLTEIFSVSGGVENLTDQRYRPYSSGLSGAGRNFIISLKAAF